MGYLKKLVVVIMAICMMLVGVPLNVANADNGATIEIKVFDSGGETTEIAIGDFVDATIYVSDSLNDISTMNIPIHFNPNIVEVWTTDNLSKVTDGVKDLGMVNEGAAGLILGDVFDKSVGASPDYEELYWAGDLIYNETYTDINNTEGLIKTSAYKTSAKSITTTESVFTIRFKVVGKGNPDIRFATDSDIYYDLTAPSGARLEPAVSYSEIIPTITAYDPNQLLIDYESNGGTLVESVRVDIGTELTEPTSTKEGYTVEGWYMEDTFDNKVTFPYTVVTDVTLYVNWEAVDYSVTYNGNEADNGLLPSDSTVYNITDTITVLGNTGSLEKDGYTFEGWNIESTGGGMTYQLNDTFLMGSENITLYAIWEAVDYSVTYNGNESDSGLLPSDSTVYNITDTITVLGNTGTLEREEYTFDGWNTKANGDGTTYKANDKFAMGSDNVILYAVWSINEYTIDFLVNDGTAVADISQNYNTTIDISPTTTREGYTFGQWYKEDTLTTIITFPYTILADGTMHAAWDAIDYAVTYDDNGSDDGTVAMDATVYNITDTITVLGNTGTLEKEGYTFDGWNTKANGDGTTYKANDEFAMGSVNVTLYAVWTINEYTIDFLVNDGTAVADINQNYNTTIDISPTTTKEGYTFGEWYKEDTLITIITFPYTIVADGTMHAAWDAIDYSILYDGNNNSAGIAPIDANIYNIGNTITVLENTGNLSIVEGNFVGWNTKADGTGITHKVADEFTMGSQNITLYAYWDMNEYTVTFNSKGGSSVASITQEYETAIENGPTSSRTSYTFAGWYLDEAYETEAKFPLTITKDIELYAKWNIVYTGAVGPGVGSVLSTSINSYNASREIADIIEADEKRIIDLTIASTSLKDLTVLVKGKTIRELYENGFDLLINTHFMNYTITFTEKDIEEELEKRALKLEDLDNLYFEIVIVKLEDNEKELIEGQLEEDIIVVVSPISYKINIKEHIYSVATKIDVMSQFSRFTKRLMALPDGYTKDSSITGVVVNEDGSLSPVPSTIIEIEGKLYVRIMSLSNSTYLVIENAISVESVKTHWSKEIVEELASKLVIDNPENFNPNQIITRGEFADYITKALGIYRTGIAQKLFSDVALNNQYADAITAAVEFGIIDGYPDGTFKPNAKIRREEAMLMFARAMKVVGLNAIDNNRIDNYLDKGEVSTWAYEGVKNTLSVGVFNGRTADTIVPKGTFTHAEAATAIHNLLIASGLY